MINKKLRIRIAREFSEEEQIVAFRELESITLQHVMAESQYNLDNTWASIVELAQGDLEEVKILVEAAKRDFRDVIYWAVLKKQEST